MFDITFDCIPLKMKRPLQEHQNFVDAFPMLNYICFLSVFGLCYFYLSLYGSWRTNQNYQSANYGYAIIINNVILM